MEGLGLDRLPVRHKAKGQLPQRLGQRLEPLHLLIGHRLGNGSVAHPVDAGQGIGDKVVVGEYARVSAGNSTHKLLILRNFHHGIAAGDGAGIAADILLDTAAHHAADIIVAGKGTLGKAVPNSAAGEPRNTAYIIAVFAGNSAVAPAVRNKAKLHPAADAAGIAALGRNGAHVFAAVHDGFQLIPPPLGQAAAGAIVLRIHGGFQAHRAGNAAHVQVGLHDARVGAAGHPSVGNVAQIHGGNIRHRVLLRVLGGKGKGLGNGLNLAGNGADIIGQSAQTVANTALQAAAGIDHTMDGIAQAGQSVLVEFQIFRRLHQVIDSGAGTALVARQSLDAALDVAAAGRAVVAGPAYQIAQIFKLLTQSLQIVLGKEGLDMGLNLTHNAAHILPTHEGAAVLAVFNEAAVPAGNAAQIIADVRIADGAGIAGGGNGAAGIAGDTAGVAGGIGYMQVCLPAQIQIEVQIQLGNVNRRIHTFRVDGHGVAAADDFAVVIADNTAGSVAAGEAALGGAAVQGAVIAAGDATGIAFAGNGAGEGAVFQAAVVFACDAAGIAALSPGLHGALHGQIPNPAGGLDNTEKARRGKVAGEVQIGDHMAVALKDAAEGGNGLEVHPSEGNIRLQNHPLIQRPGIQGAVFSQSHQILRNGDGNGFPDFDGLGFLRLGFRRLCRLRRLGGLLREGPERKPQKEHQGHDNCR